MSLYRILKPHTIAVVGASRDRGAIGHQVVANLVDGGFTGTVYPVNPRASAIHSIHCYPSVDALPEAVDLAVIAVPSPIVGEVAEQCGRRGVSGLVVLSAGFREVGGDGTAREAALMETVRRYGMRLVGPNCVGIMNTDPMYAMNATFGSCVPPAGQVGFVTQSGALGLSVLDYAREIDVGIAQFVSVGNCADLSTTDVLLEWEQDPAVQVIVIYQEGFREPRRFLEVASRVTRSKPVIVLKAGRSPAGARAASSHTGALAASDIAVHALLAQAGVLQVSSVEELFDAAMAFGSQPLPRSRRTAVITNAGGPGILAADALAGSGLELCDLSAETVNQLRAVYPPEASIRNPLDMIATARPDGYRVGLEALLTDPNVDSVIATFVPLPGVREEDVADAIVVAARKYPAKPVLAILMGRDGLPQGRTTLHGQGIPAYVFPESAARALAALCRYRESLARSAERPEELPVDRRGAATILERGECRAGGRLDQADALALLEAYGIPAVQGAIAESADGAADTAQALGCPVAMKVISRDITHKTDVSGVRLGIATPELARAAYRDLVASVASRAPAARIDGVLVQRMVTGGHEMIAGLTYDPLFGPLVMVGLGGILVEAIRDVAFRLAPIGESEARAMVASLRSAAVLAGVRGQAPADVRALLHALRRLSQLAIDFPSILELDVNPLVVSPDGVLAVDARVIVRCTSAPPQQSPTPVAECAGALSDA